MTLESENFYQRCIFYFFTTCDFVHVMVDVSYIRYCFLIVFWFGFGDASCCGYRFAWVHKYVDVFR